MKGLFIVGKYFEDGSFKHCCTGSIIAPGIVLSAAHCISSAYFDKKTFRVRAGVTNLKDNFGNGSAIRKAVFHAEYQKSGQNHLYHDLALFFLESPFTFSPTIQAICLPTTTYAALPETMLGDSLTTVGWGRDELDVVGEDLTQIDVTIRKTIKIFFSYTRSLQVVKFSPSSNSILVGAVIALFPN